MASEIRVNQIQNRSGLSTVTFSDTGVVISGITTISDLRTSGNTVVAAGTTAAPSISPTGDSNTGIFFPSPDTVAIAEGGVEALRIDSNGNLGIGTNNPDKKLVVKGSGGNFVAEFSNTNNASSNNGVYINVQNTASATQALNVVSGGTSRLFVNGAGNIGVGTDNPTYRMLIYGTSNSNEIRQTDGTVVSQWYQDFNGIGYFGTVSNHPQVFRTVGTDRVIIDTSGRVTMPYQPACDVYGTGTCTVTDGTSQNLPLTTFNYNRGFSITSSKLVIPKTGYYSITTNYMSQIGGSTYSVRAIRIFPRINGTVLTYPDARWNSAPTAGFSNTHYEIKHNWILNLSENDQLDLQVTIYHNRGSALSETYYTSIIGHLLG